MPFVKELLIQPQRIGLNSNSNTSAGTDYRSTTKSTKKFKGRCKFSWSLEYKETALDTNFQRVGMQSKRLMPAADGQRIKMDGKYKKPRKNWPGCDQSSEYLSSIREIVMRNPTRGSKG